MLLDELAAVGRDSDARWPRRSTLPSSGTFTREHIALVGAYFEVALTLAAARIHLRYGSSTDRELDSATTWVLRSNQAG